MAQPGGVLVPLLHEAREAIKEIGVFALLCKSNYDLVYGFVSFSRTEEILWSADSSIAWFPYSWDTERVANIPIFELETKKRKIRGARRVVEEYPEIRAFIHAWPGLLSVVHSKRQSAARCAEVDASTDNGGIKGQSCTDEILPTFRLKFETMVTYHANIGEAAPLALGDMFSLALGDSGAVASPL